MKSKFTKDELSVIRKWVSAGALSVLSFFVLSNFKVILDWLMGLYNVLIPFVFGYFISFILFPAVIWVQKHVFHKIKNPRMSRLASTLVVVLGVVLILSLMVILSIPDLVSSVVNLATQLPTILGSINQQIESLNLPVQVIQSLQGFVVTVQNYLSGILTNAVSNLINQAPIIVSAVFNGAMAMIIAIYFLFEKEFYQQIMVKILKALFSSNRVNRLRGLAKISGHVYRDFINSRFASSSLMLVLIYLTLVMTQIEHALFFSLLLAIANLVPILGLWLGLVPLLLLLYFINAWSMVLVLMVSIVFLALDYFKIQPFVRKNDFHLKTFWVVLVTIFVGPFFGLMGVLLALPLVSLAYQFASTYYRLERVR